MANFRQVQSDMKYKQAKGSLLAIILFSLVNLFALTFTDSYFLFSAYFTQLFGYMAWAAAEEAVMGLAFVFIFIGALTLVPYLLCFIFLVSIPSFSTNNQSIRDQTNFIQTSKRHKAIITYHQSICTNCSKSLISHQHQPFH